jgi:hypothetical protein
MAVMLVSFADDDFASRHEQAKHRTRRVIFNNDGDDAIYFAREATPEGLWAVRGAPVLDSQVDTMCYCVNIGLGMFRVPVPFGELLTKEYMKGRRNITDELVAQGTDALRVMVERCRSNDIELFVSLRMNDIHDGVNAKWNEVFFSQWKKDHREWLHGNAEDKPPFGYWSGADYARPEVRDYVCTMVEHFCSRYDVDGVELDFWRHPPHFRTCAWGEPATTEECALMTEMLRRIRAMTRRVADERGRPLLICARILEDVELSVHQGLDLATWLREDLLDLLVTGEFTQDKWTELIRLGRAHDVPVYAGLRRNVPLKDGYLESLRGQALTAHHLGASGVYLFNLFPEAIQAQFGSLEPFFKYGEIETLAHTNKIYSFARADDILGRYLCHGVTHLPTPSIGRDIPFALASEQNVRLPIDIWDDVAGADNTPAVRLRATFDEARMAEDCAFMINGTVCERQSASEAGEEVFYVCEGESLRQGSNLVTVQNRANHQVRLKDLRLVVTYSR